MNSLAVFSVCWFSDSFLNKQSVEVSNNQLSNSEGSKNQKKKSTETFPAMREEGLGTGKVLSSNNKIKQGRFNWVELPLLFMMMMMMKIGINGWENCHWMYIKPQLNRKGLIIAFIFMRSFRNRKKKTFSSSCLISFSGKPHFYHPSQKTCRTEREQKKSFSETINYMDWSWQATHTHILTHQ